MCHRAPTGHEGPRWTDTSPTQRPPTDIETPEQYRSIDRSIGGGPSRARLGTHPSNQFADSPIGRFAKPPPPYPIPASPKAAARPSAAILYTPHTYPYTCPLYLPPYLPIPTPTCPYLRLPAHTYPYLPIPTPTCPYLRLPAHTYPYLPIPAHTCPYLPLPTPACPYLPIPTHTCPYLPIPAHTCPYLPVPAHTCPYLPIPAHTCLDQGRRAP
jgi:hypothetical protein